jgi:glucose-1-phosphatase
MSAPPATPDIRLVCFDWGGVILRICRSWAEGCVRAGVPLREGVETPALKEQRRRASDDYQAGRIDGETFFQRLAAATGGLYTPDEVRLVHDAWMIEEYPGVAGLIDRLLAVRGVETALLSNTNQAHWARHIAEEGREADFPTVARLHHRHASHLLGLIKPDIAIYRALEQRTGVPGSRILFFDDLLDNIEAARRAGWHAEQIDHTGDTAAQIERHLIAYRVLPGR